MKRIATKLASIILALALLGGLAATAAQAVTYGPGTKLVVLGDSIPWGEGATDRLAQGCAPLLAADMGFELENLAKPGHKSTDLLAILADEEKQQIISQADIITLNIGGNDLLASNVITLVLRLLVLGDTTIVDEYIEEFQARFAQIVEEVRALNPDALFIVQTLYNCMGGVPLVGGAYEVALLKLNQVYIDYEKAHPGVYKIADVFGAFQFREGLVFSDRLHPSDDGHEMIARVLKAAIENEALGLEPAVDPAPGFFKQVVIFFRALVDYLGYWLSVYSPLELLQKAIGFIV